MADSPCDGSDTADGRRVAVEGVPHHTAVPNGGVQIRLVGTRAQVYAAEGHEFETANREGENYVGDNVLPQWNTAESEDGQRLRDDYHDHSVIRGSSLFTCCGLEEPSAAVAASSADSRRLVAIGASLPAPTTRECLYENRPFPVTPQLATDHSNYAFPVPIANYSSGYDSPEDPQAQRDTLLRICRLVPAQGPCHTLTEVAIMLPEGISVSSHGAFVWWRSDQDSGRDMKTRCHAAPNRHCVCVYTPDWPTEETVSVVVEDAGNPDRKLGIATFAFTGDHGQDPQTLRCSASGSWSQNRADIIYNLKSLTHALETSDLHPCSSCKTEGGRQDSLSCNADGEKEYKTPCFQCSIVLPNGTVLSHEQLVTMVASLEQSLLKPDASHAHEQSRVTDEEDACYSSVNIIPSPSLAKNPSALYDEPFSLQVDIRPNTTGLAPPAQVHMPGQKLGKILEEVRDRDITLDKAVEKIRTYSSTNSSVAAAATCTTSSQVTDTKMIRPDKVKRKKCSATKRGLLRFFPGFGKNQAQRKLSGKSMSNSSTDSLQLQEQRKSRGKKGSQSRQRKKGVQNMKFYEDPVTDESPAYNVSQSSGELFSNHIKVTESKKQVHTPYNSVVQQLKHQQASNAPRSEDNKKRLVTTEKTGRYRRRPSQKSAVRRPSIDSGILVAASDHIPLEAKVRSLDRNMKLKPPGCAQTRNGKGRSQSKKSY